MNGRRREIYRQSETENRKWSFVSMNWMPLQSGIGIEIDQGTLRAVFVKRQWKQVRFCDRMEIPNYLSVGPDRCGDLFREFLHKNGLKSPWTVVALPRSSILLRYMQFPIAAEKELGHAIEYQVDSLHPFEEGSVYWSYSSWIPKSVNTQKNVGRANNSGPELNTGRVEALVSIVEKSLVDDLATWFHAAGIGVSQFTVTTGALLAMAQPIADTYAIEGGKKTSPFLMLHITQDHAEIAGLAPNVALISKEISAHSGRLTDTVLREIETARSELRLNPNERIPLILSGVATNLVEALASNDLGIDLIPCSSLLPKSGAASASTLESNDYVAFAAGCAAADQSRPYSLNLLPEHQRTFESTAAYLPAYALVVLIVILGIALAVRGTVQDWQYNKYLDEQIQALQPQIALVEHIQDRNRKTFTQINELMSIKRQTSLPLEALNELTALIPDDAWVQQLVYDGQTVSMSGSAKSASQIIPALAGSAHFENPQLLSAISKSADGKEIFRIGFRLKTFPQETSNKA